LLEDKKTYSFRKKKINKSETNRSYLVFQESSHGFEELFAFSAFHYKRKL